MHEKHGQMDFNILAPDLYISDLNPLCILYQRGVTRRPRDKGDLSHTFYNLRFNGEEEFNPELGRVELDSTN